MCVSETWLTTTPSVTVPLRNFDVNVFHSKATKEFKRGRARGGLLIFANANKYSMREICVNETFICVQFKNLFFEVIVCLVYLSPLSNFDKFKSKIKETLYELSLKYPDNAVIIGGDFNCKIGSLNQLDRDIFLSNNNIFEKRSRLDLRIDKKGLEVVELFEQTGYCVLNGRTRGDYPAQITYSEKGNSSIIDLVWINYSAAQLLSDFGVAQIPSRSDHFPLSIYFHFTNYIKQNVNKQPYFKWKEEKKEIYKNVIKYPSNQDNFKTIDEISSQLISSIKEASIESEMFITPNPTGKRKICFFKNWYDSECRKKSLLKKLLRICKRKKFHPTPFLKYEENKKEYKELLKKKKYEYKKDILNEISRTKDSSKFWKLINSFKIKASFKEYIEIEEWEKFFEPGLISKSRSIDINLQNLLHLNNPFLEEEITLEETLLSLKNCGNNKSPGPNGINYEFLKNLPGNLILYLNSMFNKILEREVVPSEWGKIYLRMLYKKGNVKDPANYRPIALVSCVAKTFTQILSNRLGTWAEMNDLFPEWQAGFRRGRSCLDNIFTLNALIQNRLTQPGGKVYVLFVDFKSAFPSINHNILWQKLYGMGCGTKFINILKDLKAKQIFLSNVRRAPPNLLISLRVYCRERFSAQICLPFSWKTLKSFLFRGE